MKEKERAPAYQRYVKQILGDDKVLAMDWDAYGMHNWLLDISWQQEPRGTIPNDQQIIRRWLRNPSDEVWRRVWPQIKECWFLLDGRLANAGMLRTAIRSKTYRTNAANGIAKREQSYGDEEEVSVVAFDLKAPEENPVWIPERAWLDFCEMRQRIRHPMTAKAKQLIIADLQKLRDGGEDPGQVLLQSVKNSWRGVFPLKGNGNGAGTNKAESRQSSNVSAIREAVQKRNAREDGDSTDGDRVGSEPDHHAGRNRLAPGEMGGVGARDRGIGILQAHGKVAKD